MSGNYSARSRFKLRSRNQNLTEHFATGYRGVTIGNESNFLPAAGTGSQHIANGGTIANNRQYICDWAWAGTDTDTGFGPPTGSPLESTSKYGCYLIDGTVGFPTNDHAGVSALATVGFEDAVIRGVSCKALRLHVAAPDNTIRSDGYGRQLWRVLQRAITSDLSRMTIQQDIYLPDLTTLLSASRRRLTIFDVKSSDDFRYLVTIIKADSTDAAKYGVPVGTIGWEIIGDNNANGGLTFEEFFRVTLYNQCAPLDHDVSIPLQEWFGFRVYWKRAASYADTTTGQFVVQIKRSTDTKWVTVWDQNATTNATYVALYPLTSLNYPNPAANNRNIHMGANGSKIQRIFRGIYGNYETYPVDVLIANEEFWSGLPDE